MTVSPGAVGGARVAEGSGKKEASTCLASTGRLTMGFLRASTITLHVGLGSACLRNAMIIWRRRSRGFWYCEWMASTSWSGKPSTRPNTNDWFCAVSSSSSIFPASFGFSVSFTTGAVFSDNNSLYYGIPPKETLPSAIVTQSTRPCILKHDVIAERLSARQRRCDMEFMT